MPIRREREGAERLHVAVVHGRCRVRCVGSERTVIVTGVWSSGVTGYSPGVRWLWRGRPRFLFRDALQSSRRP